MFAICVYVRVFVCVLCVCKSLSFYLPFFIYTSMPLCCFCSVSHQHRHLRAFLQTWLNALLSYVLYFVVSLIETHFHADLATLKCSVFTRRACFALRAQTHTPKEAHVHSNVLNWKRKVTAKIANDWMNKRNRCEEKENKTKQNKNSHNLWKRSHVYIACMNWSLNLMYCCAANEFSLWSQVVYMYYIR